ncbi:hypothetical protein B5X24_HaOG213666 [Helicoverpa armigera]|uniref:Salivary secreted peptide n=1 Tax=Helicoverpa armigera TaxID=29058 RepID=A0A2W1BI07_HELAM|nr:hypothetical protein B5X24_HaOG213666 [Helicoverpa armigera]
MAPKILITTLLLFAAALVSAQARGNFFVGNTFGAHLIYHETHSKYAIPFIVRDEDFTVTGVDNEIIEAISVSDLEGKGLSYVKSGGIGQHNVTIHLESQRSHGYKFLVEVYAI